MIFKVIPESEELVASNKISVICNKKMRNIGLFCGSSKGNSEIFEKEAENFAKILVWKEMDLIYGAGSVGLMGIVSDIMLAGKRKVTGVVPDFLMNKEVVNEDISKLIVTKDMHERKKIIIELSDCFVALPGGIGTYDEIFEVLVGMQLGQFCKPVGLLNVDGYYDPFKEVILRATKHGFLRSEHAGLVIIEENPERLIEKLEQFNFSSPENWIEELVNKGHF